MKWKPAAGLLALALGTLTACSLLSPAPSFTPTHPQDFGAGRVACSTCHEQERIKGSEKPFAFFDHTAAFVKEHRAQALADSNVCAACHGQAFCSDCHTGKTMMKPSTLHADRPDREMPHRGDYMTLHRAEGRSDPTGCFKCHGRANNEKCMVCHNSAAR